MPLLALKNFLEQNNLFDKPLLLGLSGGPDSLCLFYCLLELKIPFGVAHIDHGWRKESQGEAKILEALVKSYHLPFYLKSLNPTNFKGNLEEHCRVERYQFFKSICEKYSYYGVLVAHQWNDQNETVLKRIFEGSFWSHLSSLQPISTVFGVNVIRPFLSVSKDSILKWLSKKNIEFFKDKTNEDVKFTRGKMRKDIIPYLNHEFKKNIESSISHLSAEINELKNYFHEKVIHYLNEIQGGPFGFYLNLDSMDNIVEIKFLIKQLIAAKNQTISREQLNLAATLLVEKRSNKQINLQDYTLWFDRKRLFLVRKNTFQYELTKEKDYKIVNCSWKEGWCSGKFYCSLPDDDYTLLLPKANDSINSRSLSISKWWNNHQIPAFLRAQIPVLYKNNEIVHEFLTGKSLIEGGRNENDLNDKNDNIHKAFSKKFVSYCLLVRPL